MVEYIPKKSAIDACFNGWNNNAHDCAENIRLIPAADVRPVVLCRDCKHWKPSSIEPSFQVCTYVCGARPVRNAEDFCSYGEKREES